MENTQATDQSQESGSFDPNLNGNIGPSPDQGLEAPIGDELLDTQSSVPELEETRKQIVRAMHKKTQELADERARIRTEVENLRQKAGMMDGLMSKQWFQKASQEEMSRLQGAGTPFNVPDEQFEAVRNGDKTAFMSIVQNMAQNMLNNQVGPALGQQQEAIADVQTNQELDIAASKYPQIQELIDGENPEFYQYLDKGYDYETAFEKWSFTNNPGGSQSADGPSPEELEQQARAGSVSRGGMVQARGAPVFKAKNFEDAFDQAFRAMQSGHKDFSFTKE